MTDDGLPPLREVIRTHGLSARKSLGQNFILDLNLTRRIARAAAPFEGFDVVEIGPGPGGLTRALLMEGAGRVIAIERDPRCLPILEEISTAYPNRLTIVEGDALDTDIAKLATRPVKLVANLPYNVATPLLFQWLEVEPWPPWWESLTLMFQREVAERIVATPGSKVYGRLSVMSQWRATPKILFDVAPSAFTPPPKVTSSIVRLVAQPCPYNVRMVEFLGSVVAAAFGQRRKMLRTSLKALGTDPVPVLRAAGIDPTARAETLTVEQFLALAEAYADASPASAAK